MNHVCTQHTLLKLIQCQAYKKIETMIQGLDKYYEMFFLWKETKNAQRHEWKNVQQFITLDVDQVLLYIMKLIYQHLLLCCHPLWVSNLCRCLPKQKEQNKYSNKKHTPTCNVIFFFNLNPLLSKVWGLGSWKNWQHVEVYSLKSLIT